MATFYSYAVVRYDDARMLLRGRLITGNEKQERYEHCRIPSPTGREAKKIHLPNDCLYVDYGSLRFAIHGHRNKSQRGKRLFGLKSGNMLSILLLEKQNKK
ncbi:hypothetical protein GHT06_010699 [Daphnia sinensis]|uniref:Uncharacterized protein n=1 Tax=Daphnia sinensis TaxID=1820382 RepID=A0AAD5KYV7_9CRUS|nr:hypothetical protein GHT06_010699 [Daphnia sinensis]